MDQSAELTHNSRTQLPDRGVMKKINPPISVNGSVPGVEANHLPHEWQGRQAVLSHVARGEVAGQRPAHGA